jgi:hypothetical protein
MRPAFTVFLLPFCYFLVLRFALRYFDLWSRVIDEANFPFSAGAKLLLRILMASDMLHDS